MFYSFSCVPKDQCKTNTLVNIRDGSEDIFRTKRQAEGNLICEDLSKSCCYKDDLVTANVVEELPLEESIFIDGILSDIDNESPSDYEDYYGNEDVPCSTLARDGYRYRLHPFPSSINFICTFHPWHPSLENKKTVNEFP